MHILTSHSVVLHTHGPNAGPIHTSSVVYNELNEAEPVSSCSSFSVLSSTLQEQVSGISKNFLYTGYNHNVPYPSVLY